jgi:hypothetical protein
MYWEKSFHDYLTASDPMVQQLSRLLPAEERVYMSGFFCVDELKFSFNYWSILQVNRQLTNRAGRGII